MMQAGRDLKFISLSMSGCFSLGALLLLVERSISWFTEDPFFFLKKKITSVFLLCLNIAVFFFLSACKRIWSDRLLGCTCGISMGKT
jgi:hypothetical protein